MKRPLTTLGGVLLLLAGAAHGLLGWPAMSQALEEQGVLANLRGALAVGWSFGTVSMLTFGAILLIAARDREPWSTSTRRALLAIASAYLAFGVVALAYRNLNPHFLGFVVLGSLALVGALRE